MYIHNMYLIIHYTHITHMWVIFTNMTHLFACKNLYFMCVDMYTSIMHLSCIPFSLYRLSVLRWLPEHPSVVSQGRKYASGRRHAGLRTRNWRTGHLAVVSWVRKYYFDHQHAGLRIRLSRTLHPRVVSGVRQYIFWHRRGVARSWISCFSVLSIMLHSNIRMGCHMVMCIYSCIHT